MMYRRILLCVLLFGASALFTAPAYGSCGIGDLYDSIDWNEVTHDGYSICYTTEYEEDVAFVERWVEHAWQLMRDKYGVAWFNYARYNRPLHLFVVFLPAPNADANTGTTRFQCCYDESGAYTSLQGKFARIPYLTPSHPEWKRSSTWGVLRFPTEGYHIKNIIHEVTHAGQFSIYGGYYPSPVPWWVYEGLAEYEGTFNTTEDNRDHGFSALVQYVRDRIPDRVFCCQTLVGDLPSLSTTDAYFGGSLILKYLADTFGEDLHVRLIRHTHPTFVEALAAEFAAAGTTALEVFQGLRAWLGINVEPMAAVTLLVANFMNGNSDAFSSRAYLFNPSDSDGNVTVRVFTLPLSDGTAQELTVTPLDLGTLEARSALNLKLVEDILIPLGIALPYTTDGGNLTLEFTIQAADVRGTAQVFSSDFAFGTYPMQEIPSTSSESPAVLVANFMNGNDAALNSRVYLWNPSLSAGSVTVRVFTLPLTAGVAQELTTAPLDLGTLGAESARNLKLAEDILAPLGIALPYVTDGGNLTLEFTIQAADVRGAAQVFSSSFAFGTVPLQVIR